MIMVAALHNVSTSLLILPDGTEIAPGAQVDIPPAFAENAGVASWISDRLAVDVTPEPEPAPKGK